MKKNLLVFFVGIKKALEYRARLLVWIVLDLLPLGIVPFFWMYILPTGGEYDAQYIISYYIIVTMVGLITSMHIGGTIQDFINSGKVSPHLLRPYSYLTFIFFDELGGKAVVSGVTIISFLLAHFLFPEYVLFPQTWWHITFFVLLLVLALLLSFILQAIAGISAFWTGRTGIVMGLRYWIEGLFGGQFVPLSFYPASILAIAHFLPFQFLYSVPAQVFLGKFSIEKTIVYLGVGYLWAAILFMFMLFLWKKGLRTYDSPDG